MRWFSGSCSALLLAGVAGCARHYRSDGMVLRVQPERRAVLLSHRDIPGYMPAMAMEFTAAAHESISALKPGQRVSFQLAVSKHRSQVSRLRSLNPAAVYPLEQPPRPLIGSRLPDFTLTDERNRAVSLSGLLGRVVVLDFIYTRCPLPDVCPRLSANFRRLQRRFGSQITLLSITVDPLFDSPEVLSRYAARWSTDPETWHFLTGAPAQIAAAAKACGLLYFADEGSLTHTTETVIIGRDGTLKAIVDGPGYAVSQFSDLIALQLQPTGVEGK